MLALNGKLGRRLMYLIPVASSRLSANSKEQPLNPPAGSIALRTPFGAVRFASTRGSAHQVSERSHCGRKLQQLAAEERGSDAQHPHYCMHM